VYIVATFAGVNSTEALASLQQLDASAALALPGVTGIITAGDIPGSNTIMGAPLLADGCVEYVGQPIALVAATSQQLAERAAALVCVTYGPPPPGRHAVITLDDAVAAGAFYEDLTALMQVAAVKPGAASSSSSSSASNLANGRINHCSAAEAGDDAGSSVSGNSSSAEASASLSADAAASRPLAPAAAAVVCVEQLIASSPRQILGGTYDLPAQQHFYMETQVSCCWRGRLC
jgi:xanthine dehydrogenase molybdopterin-binding subunit B